MNEEQAVELLNKIKDRNILTDIEVELSNLCIKNKKIIKKQDELIKDYYDRMIKIKELIENADYWDNIGNKLLSIVRGDKDE